MKRHRVLVADDHTLVLDGIRKLLETEVDLVGTVGNGLELISEAQRLKPDIILLDISMPMLNGVEAARHLRKTLPNTKLIFLTMHADATYVTEALGLGASGYVLKSSGFSELIDAIHKVARGQIFITPLIEMPDGAARKPKRSADLTERQCEVLQLLAEGRCPKEISCLLQISVRTVEFHKYSIMRKLGLHNVAELTKYAVRHGVTQV